MKITDFDILNIIKDNASLKYEVIHRTNTKKYYIKLINYKQIDKKVKRAIISDYKKIIIFNQNNFLKYLLETINIIKDSDLKFIYVLQGYCAGKQLGELLVNLKNGPRFNEDFVWKMCYQCCDALKRIEQFSLITKFKALMVGMNKDCVYFDSEWNVKLDLFHFEGTYTGLPGVLFEVLMMDTWDPKSIHQIKRISQNFYDFITYLMQATTMQSVMLHPVFIKRTLTLENKTIPVFQDLNRDYLEKKERILADKERKLKETEKEIQAQLSKAEQYWRKLQNEDLNTTFSAASCDTTIIQTSTKIDTNRYHRPNFQRSHSERRKRVERVERFPKSIDDNLSQLKLVQEKLKRLQIQDLNVQVELKHATSHESLFDCKKNLRSENSLNFRPISFTGSSHSGLVEKFRAPSTGSKISKSSTKLIEEFRPASSSGSASSGNSQPMKSMAWTRESKRHAFELLKIMNNKENINATYKLPGNNVQKVFPQEFKTTYF